MTDRVYTTDEFDGLRDALERAEAERDALLALLAELWAEYDAVALERGQNGGLYYWCRLCNATHPVSETGALEHAPADLCARVLDALDGAP